jgi:hypothetical protein
VSKAKNELVFAFVFVFVFIISSRDPNKMDKEHVTKVNIKHREHT